MMILLLKRKDDGVIRQICKIIKKFADLSSDVELQHLARQHTKAFTIILHKLSKVSTYATQLKLLEVLNKILKVTDDHGVKVLRQEKILASRSRNAVLESLAYFELIEETDFVQVVFVHLIFFIS